jgi:hypothetical protein
VRDERTARAAHAFLFSRYPQWVERVRADLPRDVSTDLPPDLPPVLPLWPRPACARLCRVMAALAFARSLRRVVTAEARARFALSVAPRLLGAIQRHLRADAADLDLDVDVDLGLGLGLDGGAEPSPSLFDRRDMTALGLALAGCAAADAREAFWWSVRLPREIAEAAARYRARGLSTADARALLADARSLMEGYPC